MIKLQVYSSSIKTFNYEKVISGQNPNHQVDIFICIIYSVGSQR